MKRLKTVIIFCVILVISTHTCFAITVQEQWSKQFSNMVALNVSQDGERIGLLKKDEYLVLNQKGEVIKKGKNHNYDDIAISKDLIILSGDKTKVFDYSGKMLWEVGFKSIPYFSPMGNYIMLWEVEDKVNMYSKAGKKIIDFSIGDEICEFSKDEDYLLVPDSGLYKISNGRVSRIVSAENEWAYFEAEYLNNSKNVAIVYDDAGQSLSLRMYNPSGQLLWKRNLTNYTFLKNFESYLLLMENNTLKFLDYNNDIKYNLKFENQMFSGYESKEMKDRKLFVLNGYDSNGNYLYFINNKSQIIYKHVLPRSLGIYYNEKGDLIYTTSSKNTDLILKCYRIIY